MLRYIPYCALLNAKTVINFISIVHVHDLNFFLNVSSVYGYKPKKLEICHSIKKDNSCVLKLLKYWYMKCDFIFDNIHCIILHYHKSISTLEIFTMKSK